jgi:dienelactone hydrolase
MSIIKKLASVTALSLAVAACQTTGSTTLPNGKAVQTNYGYPDIEYYQKNTDRIVNVVNGVFVPPKPNGAGVIVLGPCPGIQFFNEEDIRELAQLFLDNGYTVAVPNYNTMPRPTKRPYNCGKDRNLTDMRLVKDVYDATAALSRAGVHPNRIFTVGQSLGAQIGADAISPNNARLAKKYNWGPVPRAVVGLYGGCRYPSKTYLDGDVVRPVLWIAGEKDPFSYTEYGCKSWTISSVMKKQPDSKFIVYKDATHCFDCKQLNGFVNKREKQTYRYNETATKQSRDEIFKFMEKFK